MVCPFCLHKKTAVYNSRPTKRLNAMWRRRRCQQCEREFTTREMIDGESIMQVQVNKSKKTIPYSRAKLLLSLLKACDHRQDNDVAVYWLCDTIEQSLYRDAAKSKGTIQPDDICQTTLSVLKKFDPSAYVKYLSYHTTALDMRTLKKQLRNKNA